MVTLCDRLAAGVPFGARADRDDNARGVAPHAWIWLAGAAAAAAATSAPAAVQGLLAPDRHREQGSLPAVQRLVLLQPLLHLRRQLPEPVAHGVGRRQRVRSSERLATAHALRQQARRDRLVVDSARQPGEPRANATGECGVQPGGWQPSQLPHRAHTQHAAHFLPELAAEAAEPRHRQRRQKGWNRLRRHHRLLSRLVQARTELCQDLVVRDASAAREPQPFKHISPQLVHDSCTRR
mmetsp:Transcript_41788/g.125052  ORF Transcript_41788/g.125052 Transcript_41788/m.125052 type:complete len:238 (-) Transcript_41788:131-844(-)